MEQTRNRGSLIVGILLVSIGILALLGRVINFPFWSMSWPLFIVGAGALFFVGMILGGKSVGFLAIPGSIITTVGLILLVQNSLGLWETWSYLWTLIFCAVGVGMAIQGAWSGKPDLRQKGWELARAGVILFLIFSIMMEFIFTTTGVSGRGTSPLWPAALILIGVYQLVTRLSRLVRSQARPQDSDLFGPIFLSGVGALVMLTNLKLIPSVKLYDLLQLWPLLLIGGGLQLLLGRRNAWISAIVGLLIVAVMFAVAIMGFSFGR